VQAIGVHGSPNEDGLTARLTQAALQGAADGGSGRGTATCLPAMDRLFGHLSAEIADLITVTRRSSAYKREAVRAGTRAMVEAMEE